MIKRVKNTKIGDVFVAKINDTHKRYFQYIVNDLEQLNSDVIRVFKKNYLIEFKPSLIEIISDEVDFYAHTTTKYGLKLELWELVGNITDVGNVEYILFRSSEDSGDNTVLISEKWWVWNVNKRRKYIGKLKGEYRKAEIGLVYTPLNIMSQLQETYISHYPKFE